MNNTKFNISSVNKKTYFVSDLHLGFLERKDDKLREDKFLKFLDLVKQDADTLYIVGDLFDFWFEYNQVIPKYFYRTLSKIHELVQSGIQIEYVMGNHDFGHIDFFKEEFGIEIYRTDIERTIYGKRFYISHGDGKAYNDTGYLILRSILRNKLSHFLFNLIHPDLGISIASGSSKKSRVYTDKKEFEKQGSKDGMIDFALKQIDSGFDYVIMGHKHKVEEIPHKHGVYYNLGHWLGNNPTYGIFDENGFRINKFT